MTGAVGLGIIGIGAGYLAAPRSISAGFGTDVSGTRAILAVKGVRDITSGLVALAAAGTAGPRTLAAVLALFSLIPLGDGGIVLATGGSRATAVGVHGATAAVMLGTAGLLLSGRHAE